jgi:hypothetical protein
VSDKTANDDNAGSDAPLPDAPLRVPTTLLPGGDALDMALVALTDWQFVSFDGVRYRLDPLTAEVAERDLARAPFMASTPADHASNSYHAHYTCYLALARDHDQRQA